MRIIYKQASKTLEYTLEYTLEKTFKQPNLKNTKLKQEFTLELTRVFEPLQYNYKYSCGFTKKTSAVAYRQESPRKKNECGGNSKNASAVAIAKAKKVLAQTTKMNNPFYYAAVKKRQNNPFQYRYDKMLNSLRRTYSADRFVSLLKVLSRSTLTERDDWLRGMEDAKR
mgnify:FL=1